MIGRQLLAAVLAIGVLAVCLATARSYVRSLEDGSAEALASRMFDLKNQGSELQAAALRDSSLLVVYGSSELEQPNPYHASNVLQDLPTGANVCRRADVQRHAFARFAAIAVLRRNTPMARGERTHRAVSKC